MNTPSVAIIVRTKDRPVFLARALSNIAEQTFTDYTIALVNDGGETKAVDALLAEQPAEFRSKIQALHRPESTGMEAATNAGIHATNSTFIAVHDDDDLWEPTFLETSVRTLVETGAAMSVVRTDEYFERITDDGFEFIDSVPFWGYLEWMSIQDFFRINRAVPISILYRRELHESLGYYNESLPVVGDWEFNIRVASAHEVVFIQENLAHWSKRVEATGANANSVYAGQNLHATYDSKVRAEAIREDLAAGGRPGPYLYQAHLANEVQDAVHRVLEVAERNQHLLGELEQRITELERQNAHLNQQISRRNPRKIAQRLTRGFSRRDTGT